MGRHGAGGSPRELQKPLVWLSCGFDRPPSRDAVDRFLTDLEYVVDDMFNHLVKQAAVRVCSTLPIESSHVEAIPWNDDASWNYDSTAEGHYCSFGCTTVSAGAEIPIAAEFTAAKQASEETAMRVTRDALAVERSGCLATARTTRSIGTYNPRNTDDPLDIEYRVEDRIEKHSEDVQLERPVLDETYNRRTQVERMIQSRTVASGTDGPEAVSMRRTQVFVALCFQVVFAITSDARGDNPGREMLTA